MPSIYPQLKKSDRKFIRTQKARIRRQFLDFKKQEEMITELYKRLLGNSIVKQQNSQTAAEKKQEKSKIKVRTKKTKVKKGNIQEKVTANLRILY